jgi:uncharacterized protein YgiM (DUF1202 family)
MSSRSFAKSILIGICGIFFFKGAFASGTGLSYGNVKLDAINIRSDSTVNSPVICVVNKGTRLQIISERYDWYKVRLPKAAAVYIKKNLTECVTFKPEEAATLKPTAQHQNPCLYAKLIKDRINVRLNPNETSPILGIVGINEVVTVISDKDGWLRIEPTENSFGWINTKFVEKVPAQAIQEERPLPQEQEDKTANLKETIARQENEVIVGIVQPSGVIFRRSATHKLISEDKKVFLLKGNKKGLDTLNYRKVKVSGKIVTSPRQRYPIIEVKTMELIS